MKLRAAFILLLTSILSLSGIAQKRQCGFDEYTLQRQENIDHLLPENLSVNSAQSRSNVTLPVVVHILENRTEEEITETQVLSQINVLNRLFNSSPDLSGLKSIYLDRVEVPMIKFQLACIDPDGNPTNGITRTAVAQEDIALKQTDVGNFVMHYDNLGGKSPWNRNKYINIWIADMGDDLLGRASLPSNFDNPEDGIVIDPTFFGHLNDPDDSAPYNEAKTLVHEMGHYLGLFHPWGRRIESPCSQDDLVEDTPEQNIAYYNCPRESVSESCGSIDMINNMMGYVDDHCLRFFTVGQVERMHAILNQFRPELINNENLTGCLSNSTDVDIFYNSFLNRLVIDDKSGRDDNFNGKIYNAAGQFVQNFQAEDQLLFSINTNSFPSGMYIVEFKNLTTSFTKKIVIVD